MKKILQIKAILLALLLTGLININQVHASSNVLFVFDVSEKMSGKFPEHTKLKDFSKIESTMEAFESMLETLPNDFNVGIEAYGHEGDKDCSAIEIISPLEPLDTDVIMDGVHMLIPEQGTIPLANALLQGGEALSEVKGDKTIVLFSNGQDTCGGDIDEVISQLKTWGIVVYVLGIDVNEDETMELSGIADENGGQFFAVNNDEEMATSLASVKEKIENEDHQSEVFFRDDFVEKSLSSQWTIANPETKLLKVDKGAVTMITRAKQAKKANNTLRLSTPDLNSDWIFIANFTVKSQSMQEVVELGVSNQKDTQAILAQLNINTKGHIVLKGIKGTKKSTSHFQEKLISYQAKKTREQANFVNKYIKSITVKLEKVGEEYLVSAKIEQLDENDKALPSNWVRLQKMKSSPLPNDTFFIRTYIKDANKDQVKNLSGEVNLKWVEVRTLKNN